MKLMVVNVIFLLIFFNAIQCQETEIKSCGANEYLDVSDFRCKKCDNTAVTSSNGYDCQCPANAKYIANKGGSSVKCEACRQRELVTNDGWQCIPCGLNCKCQSNEISIKQKITGEYESSMSCSLCQGRSKYDTLTGKCKLCLGILQTSGSTTDCSCGTLVLDKQVCAASNNPGNENKFLISYADGDITVKSAYLEANLKNEVTLCQSSKVLLACESLANMCVMQIYKRNTQSTTADDNHNACEAYMVQPPNQIIGNGWRQGYPWLYYSTGSQSSKLKILKQYSRNELLVIQLATYNITGHFMGMFNASQGSQLQLCNWGTLAQAQTYKFGTWYKESCSLKVIDLFNRNLYPPLFYDPYLSYQRDSKNYIYPIPIKVDQIKSLTGTLPNKNFAEDDWILTRRLLLVDNVGAIKGIYNENKTADFVTVAKNIRVVVTRLDSTSFDPANDGRIYVPLIEVNLTSIPRSKAVSGETVDITFEVVYRNPTVITSQINYGLAVAMGVLCALAGLYAILRTFFWSRRSGCVNFNMILLLKLLAFGCSAISNTFLIVIFGFSFYYLILYKNQQLFSVFPPDDDSFFLAYLISAFVLKLFEIIHLFVVQCTIDIFLIDWERPKESHGPKAVIEKSKFDHSQGGDMKATGENDGKERLKSNGYSASNNVSIWRTYFVANEFNELQTYRKTSFLVNLMSVLFFMEVVGFGNATTFDPYTELNPPAGYYYAPYYRLFRFAMIVLIFSLTGFIQWVISITLYERLIEDKLRNYVDLCSVSNVSVFILEHRQFGYYIHGRSVHGNADVSLAQMYESLRKENQNKCARRGLEYDSDQQTYIMALPDSFVTHFEPIYYTFSKSNANSLIDDNDRTLQYNEVNKLLDRMINKINLPKIPFVYQDRKFFEDVFDGEFEEHALEGRFYRDNGTAFGNVLFYGNEFALITFDILLFTTVDLIMQNTMFDVIITWCIVKFLEIIRNSCGSRNLAKKTMVDKRFLI